jgi:ribose 5-phosphate isomerase B
MKIAIGSDHAGYYMKEHLKKFLKDNGYEVDDCGTFSTASVDYPDFAKEVCTKIQDGVVDKGVLICGTGIGMSISANKFKGIRAALSLNPFMATLSRKHNDSNVLVLAGRLMGYELADATLEAWLNTDFEGGRHQNRLDKIAKLEQ